MKSAQELRAQARKTFEGHWGKAIGMWLLPYAFYMIISVGIMFIMLISLATIGMTMGDSSDMTPLIPVIVIFYLLIFVILFFFMIIYLGIRFKYIDWLKNPELEFSASQSMLNIFNYNIWMIIKIALWKMLFVNLWSLLFFIPGIIKAYSYSQAFNLYKTAKDNGDADQYRAIDYINQSKELMAGHKGSLFYLGLTFIGWAMLAGLTLNVGYIWLIPYMSGSQAAFFNDLIENKNK